jgi:hypothetical protein
VPARASGFESRLRHQQSKSPLDLEPGYGVVTENLRLRSSPIVAPTA